MAQGFRILKHDDEIVLSTLQHVYEHWKHLPQHEGYPQAKAFDPLDLNQMVTNIAISEVLMSGERFEFIYVGSKLVEIYGTDFSQSNVSDHPDIEAARDSDQILKLVSKGNVVVNGPLSIKWEERNFIAIQSISMPLYNYSKVDRISTAVDMLPSEKSNP